MDCGQYIGPPDLKAEPPAFQTNGQGEGPPSPAAGNDRLTQTAREYSVAIAANGTQQQSPSRLIPTQLYQPASGQLNSAPQTTTGDVPAAGNPPPAATYTAPAPSAPPQGYAPPPYAAQPPAGATVTPMPPAAPTQAAPVQPAPAYGQQMWSRQGPDQPVNSPQGPTLPGPIFSENSPFRGGPPGGGTLAESLPFTVTTEEAMTGRLQLGVGINSDAGLVGSLTLDEQNFDWTRIPTSWEDIRNGTALRGAGQQFRIQAMPGIATVAGTQPAQQYSVTFVDPFVFDTQVQLGVKRILLQPHLHRIYRPAARRPNVLRIPVHPRLFRHRGLPWPEAFRSAIRSIPPLLSFKESSVVIWPCTASDLR